MATHWASATEKYDQKRSSNVSYTRSHGKLYKVTSEAMLGRKVKEDTTIFEFSFNVTTHII